MKVKNIIAKIPEKKVCSPYGNVLYLKSADGYNIARAKILNSDVDMSKFDLSEDEIEKIIYIYYPNKVGTVPVIAKALITARNKKRDKMMKE